MLKARPHKSLGLGLCSLVHSADCDSRGQPLEEECGGEGSCELSCDKCSDVCRPDASKGVCQRASQGRCGFGERCGSGEPVSRGDVTADCEGYGGGSSSVPKLLRCVAI